MKKLILFAAILFAGVSVVKAEGEVIGEGDVNLKLRLYPFQTISIGGTAGNGSVGGEVIIDYKTAEHYSTGASTKMIGHITVKSAGEFDVSVFAKDEGKFDGGFTAIGDNGIKIKAEASTIGSATITDYPEINLSTTSTTLFSSTTGTGSSSVFDVTYTGAGSNFYDEYITDGETAYTEYTTVVTYTIAAK